MATEENREQMLWRWCYRLTVALAKRALADANAAREGNNWPAGQAWHEMVGTSHSVFLHQARDEAGVPHEEFLALARDTGAFGEIGYREYDAAIADSRAAASEAPHDV